MAVVVVGDPVLVGIEEFSHGIEQPALELVAADGDHPDVGRGVQLEGEDIRVARVVGSIRVAPPGADAARRYGVDGDGRRRGESVSRVGHGLGMDGVCTGRPGQIAADADVVRSRFDLLTDAKAARRVDEGAVVVIGDGVATRVQQLADRIEIAGRVNPEVGRAGQFDLEDVLVVGRVDASGKDEPRESTVAVAVVPP